MRITHNYGNAKGMVNNTTALYAQKRDIGTQTVLL